MGMWDSNLSSEEPQEWGGLEVIPGVGWLEVIASDYRSGEGWD
jgi:hypothetical protein